MFVPDSQSLADINLSLMNQYMQSDINGSLTIPVQVSQQLHYTRANYNRIVDALVDYTSDVYLASEAFLFTTKLPTVLIKAILYFMEDLITRDLHMKCIKDVIASSSLISNSNYGRDYVDNLDSVFGPTFDYLDLMVPANPVTLFFNVMCLPGTAMRAKSSFLQLDTMGHLLFDFSRRDVLSGFVHISTLNLLDNMWSLLHTAYNDVPSHFIRLMTTNLSQTTSPHLQFFILNYASAYFEEHMDVDRNGAELRFIHNEVLYAFALYFVRHSIEQFYEDEDNQ
jgi:hypothetical protein